MIELGKTRITIKLRLRDKHCSELNRQARAVNLVWNYCNQVSQKAWNDHHKWLSGFDLGKFTAGSSKELDVHAHTVQKVCQQFARARDKAKYAGLRWRGKRSLGWVPFNTGHVTFDGTAVKFRGIAYMPMHKNSRLTSGMKIGSGSFNQDSRGRWYINCPIEIDCAAQDYTRAIGIDLGLTSLATMSDGSKIEAHQFYRKSEQAIAAAQRASKSKRAKAIHAKAANRRKDHMHKASSALVKKFGTIVIGDVSATKIVRTPLAKSVNDASWVSFKSMLSYKAIMHGGRLIEVNERMTSQTCSCCGRAPSSRPKGIAGLRIRDWTCDDCGTVHDRDVNAAKNILRIGLDTLVEGATL